MGVRASIGLTILVAFLAGCARVKVAPAHPARPVYAGTLPANAPSAWWRDPLHREIIRRYDLELLLRRDPESALESLRRVVSQSGQVEETAALAALELRYGQTLEKTAPEKALGFFLAAASRGYERMLRSGAALPKSAFELRLRDVYSLATAHIVAVLQRLPGGMRADHVVRACSQCFCIQARAGDSVSIPSYYDEWLLAEEWQQNGLAHRFRNEGLGVPLIAIRRNEQKSPLDAHQPDEGIIHPATAVLHFPSAARERSRSNEIAVLKLYHPGRTSEIAIGRHRCPLAADFTMPWATLLSRTTPLDRTAWSALWRPAETSRPQRLYLMEPYDPNRIPVIMVHGIWSTPLAWRQMTNELVGDPEIRRRFQIWHYLYPTGIPFLSSAADFRDELERVRRMLDPRLHDFAVRNIILIGHSMGGLLCRTLVTDSGDALWESTFALPATKVPRSLAELPELRRMFYFQPKSYIKRAIFIAVPHRGSKMASGPLVRFLSGNVRLPDEFHRLIDHVRAVPRFLKPDAAALFDRGFPSSIRVLSPQTEGLAALATRPVSPAIPFHSVIGDRGRGGGVRSSDGVVPYSSSHLPGARSELIVPAGHGAYEHPQAIAEVNRILKEHSTHSATYREASKQ